MRHPFDAAVQARLLSSDWMGICMMHTHTCRHKACNSSHIMPCTWPYDICPRWKSPMLILEKLQKKIHCDAFVSLNTDIATSPTARDNSHSRCFAVMKRGSPLISKLTVFSDSPVPRGLSMLMLCVQLSVTAAVLCNQDAYSMSCFLGAKSRRCGCGDRPARLCTSE